MRYQQVFFDRDIFFSSRFTVIPQAVGRVTVMTIVSEKASGVNLVCLFSRPVVMLQAQRR